MMKTYLHIIGVLLVILSPAGTASGKQTRRSTLTRGQCIVLRDQYLAETDTASPYMAASEAGMRSTREPIEAKQANALSRAKMAMDVLKSTGCPVPPVIPSLDKYMPAARGCMRSQIMSQYGDTPRAECDPTRWQSSPSSE